MSRMELIVSLFCAVMISTVIAGCGSTSSSSSDSAPSGPSNFSQNLLDSDLVWAVNGGMNQIYNDNLAGHTVGNQNLTANCPLGGTVNITGTTGTTANTGITTVELTYDMTGCKVIRTSSSGTSVSLTLTGSLAYTGSFNSATNFKSENFQSQSLTMTGTAHRTGYNDATVNNANCSYSGASTSTTISGSICGNPAISYAF